MQAVSIRLRIHRYTYDTHLSKCSDNSDCNLSSVCNQDTLQQLSEGGEKAIMQKYMELFYASIDDENNLTSTEAELKLVKSGGVWKVDEDSTKNFSHLMSGNFNLSGGGR